MQVGLPVADLTHLPASLVRCPRPAQDASGPRLSSVVAHIHRTVVSTQAIAMCAVSSRCSRTGRHVYEMRRRRSSPGRHARDPRHPRPLLVNPTRSAHDPERSPCLAIATTAQCAEPTCPLRSMERKPRTYHARRSDQRARLRARPPRCRAPRSPSQWSLICLCRAQRPNTTRHRTPHQAMAPGQAAASSSPKFHRSVRPRCRSWERVVIPATKRSTTGALSFPCTLRHRHADRDREHRVTQVVKRCRTSANDTAAV